MLRIGVALIGFSLGCALLLPARPWVIVMCVACVATGVSFTLISPLFPHLDRRYDAWQADPFRRAEPQSRGEAVSRHRRRASEAVVERTKELPPKPRK